MNFDHIHALINGDIQTTFGTVSHNLWNIFSLLNGNPDIFSSGIRFTLSIFFSILLLIILQIRTKMIFDRPHLIAFVGVLFLLIRNIITMGFQWGWEIGLYNDAILHFLSPPIEYFFNMLFMCCIAYYSLNAFNYYPGMLKRIIWGIPSFIAMYFVYMAVTWKNYFYDNLPSISTFNQCSVDFQAHSILALISGYVLVVAIVKYKKYHIFLTTFWFINFVSQLSSAIVSFNNYSSSELITIFQAVEIWSIPLLVIHFVNAYIVRKHEYIERRNCIRLDCPTRLSKATD